MASPNDLAPDLRRVVEVLTSSGVDFVLVGGFAAIIHGSDRGTTDIDLAFAPDPHNVEALIEALRPLNPQPPRATGNAPWDRLSLGGEFVRIRTDAGVLDLMRRLQGVTFSELRERAILVDLYGFEVRVASAEDLIRMKEGSARAKDLFDVETLRASIELQSE